MRIAYPRVTAGGNFRLTGPGEREVRVTGSRLGEFVARVRPLRAQAAVGPVTLRRGLCVLRRHVYRLPDMTIAPPWWWRRSRGAKVKQPSAREGRYRPASPGASEILPIVRADGSRLRPTP